MRGYVSNRNPFARSAYIRLDGAMTRPLCSSSAGADDAEEVGEEGVGDAAGLTALFPLAQPAMMPSAASAETPDAASLILVVGISSPDPCVVELFVRLDVRVLRTRCRERPSRSFRARWRLGARFREFHRAEGDADRLIHARTGRDVLAAHLPIPIEHLVAAGACRIF